MGIRHSTDASAKELPVTESLHDGNVDMRNFDWDVFEPLGRDSKVVGTERRHCCVEIIGRPARVKRREITWSHGLDWHSIRAQLICANRGAA